MLLFSFFLPTTAGGVDSRSRFLHLIGNRLRAVQELRSEHPGLFFDT